MCCTIAHVIKSPRNDRGRRPAARIERDSVPFHTGKEAANSTNGRDNGLEKHAPDGVVRLDDRT